MTNETQDGMREAPPDPEAAARATRALIALALCALGIELCLLWLDRIALQRAIVWPAAESAIRALFRPLEMVFGAVREDNAVTREQVKVANLLAGFLPAFILHLCACGLVLFRLPTNDRRVLKLVLGVAVVFRLTLVPFPPILETDLHRYVWDGAVSAAHVNPYKYAPAEIRLAEQPARMQHYTPEDQAELAHLSKLLDAHPQLAAHFPRINHPKIPTIYPPLAQILFSVAHRIAPGSDVPVKALVVIVDLMIIGMIVLLLGELGLNRCQVVLYAWSPLILKEYANTGHYDPLATLMVLVALHMILRRMPVLPGIALALGTAAKFYPLVVALVLAPWIGILGFLAYAATLVMMYVPYLGIGPRMFEGLKAMAADWEFNSSLFTVVERAILTVFSGRYVGVWAITRGKNDPTPILGGEPVPIDAFLLAKLVCAGTGLAFVVWLLSRPREDRAEPVVRAFAVVAALVLLSPVSDPWYYAWALPYVALYPAASWMYLSGSMIIYYLYFWSYPWGYLDGARPVEYVPFFLLLANEQSHRIAAFGAWVWSGARWIGRRVRQELADIKGAGVDRRDPS